jgi:hypothetical protein
VKKDLIEMWDKLELMTRVDAIEEYTLLTYAIHNEAYFDMLIENWSATSFCESSSQLFKDPVAKVVLNQLLACYGNSIKITPQRIFKWIETKKQVTPEIDFSSFSECLRKLKLEEEDFKEVLKRIALRNEKTFVLNEMTNFLALTSTPVMNLYEGLTNLYYALESNRSTPEFEIQTVSNLIQKRLTNNDISIITSKVYLKLYLEKRESKVSLFWPSTMNIEALAFHAIYEVQFQRDFESSLIVTSINQMDRIQEMAINLCLKENYSKVEKQTFNKNCLHTAVDSISSFLIFELKVDNLKMVHDIKTLFIYDLELFQLDFPLKNQLQFLIDKLCELSVSLDLNIIILQTNNSYENSILRDNYNSLKNTQVESYTLSLNEYSEIEVERDQ